MRRLIYLLVVAALLMVPAASAGAEGEVYATTVAVESGAVTNATAALYAPDGGYATIGANSDIILDLGGSFDGVMTFYFSAASPACQIGTGNGTDTIVWQNVFTTPGSDTLIYPSGAFAGDTGIRQLGIQCGALSKRAVFQLDAVQVAPTAAAANNGYGVQVFMAGGAVTNVTAALGVPDGKYATIGTGGGTIALHLGAPFSGVLTIYHSTASPMCEIMSDNGTLGNTKPGAGSTVIRLNEGTTATIVGIECGTLPKKTVFQLDAVQIVPLPAPTGYGLLVQFATGAVTNATAALGLPDKTYATIGANSYIVLDLVAPLNGDLTIYHSPTSAVCEILAGAETANPTTLGFTAPDADSTVFQTLMGVRFVFVVCSTLAKKTVFQLDAVEVRLPGTGS